MAARDRSAFLQSLMISGRHLGVPLVTRVAGLWRGLHRPAKGLRVLPVGKPAIREATACRISLQIAHEGVDRWPIV